MQINYNGFSHIKRWSNHYNDLNTILIARLFLTFIYISQDIKCKHCYSNIEFIILKLNGQFKYAVGYRKRLLRYNPLIIRKGLIIAVIKGQLKYLVKQQESSKLRRCKKKQFQFFFFFFKKKISLGNASRPVRFLKIGVHV